MSRGRRTVPPMTEVASPIGGKLDLRAGLPSDADSLRREMLTILLAFNRFSAAQLGEALGVGAQDIENLRSDPDVMELVLDLRGLLPRPDDINELLMSDAERNIRWLRRLREGQFDHVDPKALRVRERAAEVLLDRQVPKKVAIVASAGPRELDITPRQRDRMKALMGEDDETVVPALPAPPEPPDADVR